MEVKMLEVRDRGTFIPVMAVQLKGRDSHDRFLLAKAGFGPNTNLIQVVHFSRNISCYDCYDWGSQTRTMPNAHKYIEDNWDTLDNGAVIDVEFILEETKKPKISEREEY